jgi:hypothetical protein
LEANFDALRHDAQRHKNVTPIDMPAKLQKRLVRDQRLVASKCVRPAQAHMHTRTDLLLNRTRYSVLTFKTNVCVCVCGVFPRHQLVPLPREPTVAQILSGYKAQLKEGEQQEGERRVDRPSTSVLFWLVLCGGSGSFPGMWVDGYREVEVVDGIQKYFDAALGSLLLYRFERIQYAEAIKSFAGKRMSEVYGAEHLLRLFGTHHTALLRYFADRLGRRVSDASSSLSWARTAQLPELVAEAGIDEEGRLYIKEKGEAILEYPPPFTSPSLGFLPVEGSCLTRTRAVVVALLWRTATSRRTGKRCCSRTTRNPPRSIGAWPTDSRHAKFQEPRQIGVCAQCKLVWASIDCSLPHGTTAIHGPTMKQQVV